MDVEPPRCPVCADAVGLAAQPCPRCKVPYHWDCWEYAGGCAIFGCNPSRVPARRGAVRPAWPRANRMGRILVRNGIVMVGGALVPLVWIVALSSRHEGWVLALLAWALLTCFVGTARALARWFTGPVPGAGSRPPEPWLKTRMVASMVLLAVAPGPWAALVLAQLGIGISLRVAAALAPVGPVLTGSCGAPQLEGKSPETLEGGQTMARAMPAIRSSPSAPQNRLS